MNKNLFIMQSGRSWGGYSKQAALALSTKITQLSIWLLYEGLNRPFGLCVYTLCCIYGWYGTQRAVLFSSQMVASYYVLTLVFLSLILPVLILVPATLFSNFVGESPSFTHK